MPDPIDLRPRALRRLARDAVRARGTAGLAALAQRSGQDARTLRLLADAWLEGGPSGLAALGPAPAATDEAAMVRADGALEAWRRRHFPLEALRWDVWRNRVTVWHLLPGADRRGDLERRALCHLRLTPDGAPDGRWHLYRKAAQGEWWPVVVQGRRAAQDLRHCLDAVRVDAVGQFWSSRPSRPEGSDSWFDDGARQ